MERRSGASVRPEPIFPPPAHTDMVGVMTLFGKTAAMIHSSTCPSSHPLQVGREEGGPSKHQGFPSSRRRVYLVLMLAGLILAADAGCGSRKEISSSPGGMPSARRDRNGDGIGGGLTIADQRAVILKSVIELIRTAPENPGARNFAIAVDSLNQCFIDEPDGRYRVDEATRALFQTLSNPPAALTELESRQWVELDARHVEDCLLYSRITRRLTRDDRSTLENLERLFDWTITQVALAPANWLTLDPRLPQAQARPYDVLIRGLAVERGLWAERSWLFMALCRQLNLDAALVTVDPPDEQVGETLLGVAVVVDGEMVMFNLSTGFPLRDAQGQRATLAAMVRDPDLLRGYDLPESPFPVQPADLVQGKVTFYLDSSRGYMCPKMKLLQELLSADLRMILHREPSAQFDAIFKAASAAGLNNPQVAFWDMPRQIEQLLLTSPQFVASTKDFLLFFNARLELTPEMPLLAARLAQLRGDLGQAKTKYVNFRFADRIEQRDGNVIQLPRELQAVLDLYATYFLGLCHLEAGNFENARRMFEQTLTLSPEPRRDLSVFVYPHVFRWSALSNLARLEERAGQIAEAIRDYTRPNDLTPQKVGDQQRATQLVFDDPMRPLAPPRPPAPTSFAGVSFENAPPPPSPNTAPASPASGSPASPRGG